MTSCSHDLAQSSVRCYSIRDCGMTSEGPETPTRNEEAVAKTAPVYFFPQRRVVCCSSQAVLDKLQIAVGEGSVRCREARQSAVEECFGATKESRQYRYFVSREATSSDTSTEIGRRWTDPPSNL